MSTSLSPIVYVWLGDKLPKWYAKSIAITKSCNYRREFILITDNAEVVEYSTSIFDSTHLVSKAKLKALAKQFAMLEMHQGDFWLRTSVRFLAIHEVCLRERMPRFFHLEFDNIASDLTDLDFKLDQYGQGLFVPRDAVDRGIASLIYCNNSTDLKNLMKYYAPPYFARNDMEALGFYLQNKPYVHSLPTESYQKIQHLWQTLQPEDIGYLFDAAAIGQFCLGVDPQHNPYTPTYNLFVNENSRIDWKSFYLSFSKTTWKVALGKHSCSFLLANIHCHSKNMEKAKELILDGVISRKLRTGQSTLIAGKYNRARSIIKYPAQFSLKLGVKLLKLICFLWRDVRSIFQVKTSVINQLYKLLLAYGNEEPKPRISNYPFLSGDFFLNTSNAYALASGDKFLGRSQINHSKDILFLERALADSSQVRRFSRKFKVILIHNGDDWLDEKSINDMTTGSNYIFSTNTSKGPFWEPLPIGIENAHHGRNGSIHYYHHRPNYFENLIKDKSLLVSFNVSTNPDQRYRIAEACCQAGFPNEKLKVSDYRTQLARSRFVVSPPGNGADCHRTWEAFYHRTIPVIEKKSYLFSHIDLPVLICEDIHDFLHLTEDEMLEQYETIYSRSYPAIYCDWWIARILDKID